MMRRLGTWYLLLIVVGFLASCSNRRVYEDNYDFPKRTWVVTDEPEFEFTIPDSAQAYNIFYNVRNSLDYGTTRINVTYALYDSTGGELMQKLVYHDLFEKSGKPLGESGIGDLYDHQFPLLTDFRFPTRGRYSIRLTQFMLQDTVAGLLSVGIRVEKAEPKSGTE